MMLFYLNGSDLKLILEVTSGTSVEFKFSNAQEHVVNGKYSTGRYIVDLESDEMDMVLDLLSDCLINFGLKESGQPSALGNQLESLIDVFTTDEPN